MRGMGLQWNNSPLVALALKKDLLLLKSRQELPIKRKII